MAESPLQWTVLASVFPATLDTDTDPAKLQDGTTPDSYGLGLDAPGLLYPATVPTGTAKTAKTYTISTADWTWYFRRLWRMSGAELLYGAPEYTAIVFKQGRGVISFNEDSNSLVTFFPFGDNMFVAKTTGGYVVPNAISPRGRYEHLNIMEELAVPSSGKAIEMNGIVYVSNASGLYAFDGQKTIELTARTQDATTLAAFTSQTLTIQQSHRRIVLGSSGVADSQGRLFRYSSSNFRFTTRALRSRRDQPLAVRGTAFLVDNPSSIDGTITYQYRGDGGWDDNKLKNVEIKSEYGPLWWAKDCIDDMAQSRQFQLRVTAMTSGLRIRRISVDSKVMAAEESYPNE